MVECPIPAVAAPQLGWGWGHFLPPWFYPTNSFKCLKIKPSLMISVVKYMHILFPVCSNVLKLEQNVTIWAKNSKFGLFVNTFFFLLVASSLTFVIPSPKNTVGAETVYQQKFNKTYLKFKIEINIMKTGVFLKIKSHHCLTIIWFQYNIYIWVFFFALFLFSLYFSVFYVLFCLFVCFQSFCVQIK